MTVMAMDLHSNPLGLKSLPMHGICKCLLRFSLSISLGNTVHTTCPQFVHMLTAISLLLSFNAAL